MPPELFEKSKPEFVSPMVMLLASEACQESGSVFNVGMGYFNRAAIHTGPGVQLGDLENLPTPEMIRENMDAINSLEGATEMADANAAIFALISPPADAGAEKPAQDGAGDLDVEACFAGMQDTFNADAAEDVHVVFQFSISGQGGGEWNCIIKDKTCTIAVGTHDKPNCTLKMADNDFLDMMTGKLPAMQAYTSGKLQIEGDILKSQLIEKLFTI